ncbi:MAG: CDP-diacylglycerol--serine O-phosphatidyltransferase [Planctomycetota bacterium]|jgi:CDP-diacylglycerol--serine O-phosphatidyltransferase
MPRLKTQAAKKSLLRRVRKQRLKYITILPSLITILNGVCGFAAIIFASKDTFALAGYMILLAMIADMLDGRLARSVKSTSSFGGQLDSLCDIISFGVAPAFLMLVVLEYGLESAGLPNGSFLQRFLWLTAAVYISCAAIRLARFNVENEEDESAHMSFVGLPTPAAAGVIVSLVILHQETLPSLNVIIYALPFIALGVAILMVSRLRYPHILNQYLRGKKPFAHLIRVLLLLAFVIVSIQAALVLIFCAFAASSFVKWFYYKVIRNKGDLVSAAQHPALITVDEAQIAEQNDSTCGAED